MSGEARAPAVSERISPQDETARALRGLHRRRDADDDLEEPWCDEDAEDWPCGVIRLLDERDADRAELDVLRGELQAANRKLALLGNDHFVTFTNDRFTVEHSVDCRLSGLMHECEYHTAVERIADEGFDPELVGRWRIVDIADGLPSLEMAAVIGEEPK